MTSFSSNIPRYAQLDEMIAFTAAVEERLNECLRNDTIPDADLTEAIAVRTLNVMMHPPAAACATKYTLCELCVLCLMLFVFVFCILY